MIQQAVGLCESCQRPYTLGEFHALFQVAEEDGPPAVALADWANCRCGGIVVVAKSRDLDERDLWVSWESYLAAHPDTARRPVLMVSSRWERWVIEYDSAHDGIGGLRAALVALALLVGIAIAAVWKGWP
jgi:hypothetical protein